MKISASSSAARPPLARMSVSWVLCLVVGLMGVLLLAQATGALVGAAREQAEAGKVVTLSVGSRALLGTLLANRLERGTALTALGTEAAAAPDMRAALAKGRAAADKGFADTVAALEGTDQPTVAATLGRLREVQAALVALRPRIDTALDRARTDREASILADATAAYGALLDGLSATTDAVDTAISSSDPAMRAARLVKRSAWATRVAAGGAALRLQTGVANPASWSPAGTLAAAEDRGRVDQTWAGAVDAVSRVPDGPIRAAFETAQARNFSAAAKEERRALAEALGAGRPVGIAIQDLRRRDTDNQATIVDLANVALDAMVDRARILSDEAKRTVIRNGAILAAALLLAVLGLLCIVRGVLRPIRAMTRSMGDLAAGRLDAVVPGIDRRDEIGAMAAAVQVFKTTMIQSRRLEDEAAQARLSAEAQRLAGMRELADRLEATVGEVVDTVSTSATQLQATARSMTAVAARTTDESGAASGGAQAVSGRIDSVADAAGRLGQSVAEIGRRASASADLARTATDEAGRTAALVQELDGAVAKIGDVVGIIASIAGQTNLLALNATIEAARAGEAGRGFSVVAAEVKELANQTAKATDEISSQIARIQDSTAQAVSAIGGFGTRIREISSVTRSIAVAVEEQGAATRDIVHNASHAANGARVVTQTIDGVAATAGETGTAADHVLAAASALSHQSEDLRQGVSRFLERVRAA
ncbi:methyl-accepting chemotaxis protein [Methylobacterium indicum]|nr:methyl-accepting chemotaxis protein [Methylobacterium indicum]